MTGPEHGDELHELLTDWGAAQRASVPSPPRPELLERHRSGGGRARWWVPAAAALVVAVAASSVVLAVRGHAHHASFLTAGTATTVTSVRASRNWVRDARLVRRISLDGGALQLGPPTADDPTVVDEARALALWRSGPDGIVGSTTTVGDVVIARARVTLALPVNTLDSTGVRVARPPVFRDRDGWVLLSDRGTYNCPAAHGGPVATGSSSVAIWLLSSDGADAVDYTTGGVRACGGSAAAPTAQLSGFTSLGVAGPGTSSTCSRVGSTSSTTNGPPQTAIVTLLGPTPCTGGLLPAGLHPGPLAVARTTGSAPTAGLDYFDGHQHHAP